MGMGMRVWGPGLGLGYWDESMEAGDEGMGAGVEKQLVKSYIGFCGLWASGFLDVLGQALKG